MNSTITEIRPRNLAVKYLLCMYRGRGVVLDSGATECHFWFLAIKFHQTLVLHIALLWINSGIANYFDLGISFIFVHWGLDICPIYIGVSKLLCEYYNSIFIVLCMEDGGFQWKLWICSSTRQYEVLMRKARH